MRVPNMPGLQSITFDSHILGTCPSVPETYKFSTRITVATKGISIFSPSLGWPPQGRVGTRRLHQLQGDKRGAQRVQAQFGHENSPSQSEKIVNRANLSAERREEFEVEELARPLCKPESHETMLQWPCAQTNSDYRWCYSTAMSQQSI